MTLLACFLTGVIVPLHTPKIASVVKTAVVKTTAVTIKITSIFAMQTIVARYLY
jgi:hypothetical protein